MADIKSGARRSAWHGGSYLPVDLMRDVAVNADDADVAVAAEYFSAQTLRPRVTVIERPRIPRMRVMVWMDAADPRCYIVLVPPGSVKRGHEIATLGRGVALAETKGYFRSISTFSLVPLVNPTRYMPTHFTICPLTSPDR